MDSILIACIGNIFQGDDGFGCEVARNLQSQAAIPGVKVVDFGIRAYDLAYALLDPWKLVILVDAVARGGSPGTLYVIEPDLTFLDSDTSPITVEAHRLQPDQVLRLAHALGGRLPRLLFLGCEPEDLGDPHEGKLGLTDVMRAAAAAQAPAMIASLIERQRDEAKPARLENIDDRGSLSIVVAPQSARD